MVVRFGAVAILFFLLLFAQPQWEILLGPIGFILRQFIAIYADPETQWIFFSCLTIYFVAFLLLRSGEFNDFLNPSRPNIWLLGCLLGETTVYAFNYSPSTPAIVLLGGAVIGKGAALWMEGESGRRNTGVGSNFQFLVILILAVELALASLYQKVSLDFEYHGHARWSGVWNSPNVAGLITGTGMVLAFGMGIQGSKYKDKLHQQIPSLVLCLCATTVMSRGLLLSYSRGAWVGTLLGLSYLIWHAVRDPKVQVQCQSDSKCEIRSPQALHDSAISQFFNWMSRNWLSVSVIIIAFILICFGQFRHGTQNTILERACSAVNLNDFSSRNRIAAWVGALQITAEHPLIGAGWNRPQLLYNHYYLSPKVDQSAAIELNDYLMLGATLGVPTLVCFGMYVWLCLAGPRRKTKNEINSMPLSLRPGALSWLKVTCRAGAIVLAVGFWFDGGLFELATASTLWILLELGR